MLSARITEGSMKINKIAIKLLALGLAAAACIGLAACAKKSEAPKLEHSLTRFYCGEDTKRIDTTELTIEEVVNAVLKEV